MQNLNDSGILLQLIGRESTRIQSQSLEKLQII